MAEDANYNRSIRPKIRLAVLIIVVAVISYIIGASVHPDLATSLDKMVSSNPKNNSSLPTNNGNYGVNINYGGFNTVGNILAVNKKGLVMQTSKGNAFGVTIDKNTVYINPSGRKIYLSSLKKGNIVSVVTKLDAGGQFVALRIIQE